MSATMPYNTRRKSVSLSSLGIHVPSSSRAAAHRSPSMTAAASAPTPPSENERPPTKKIKRSHTSASPRPLSPTSPIPQSRPLPPIFKHACATKPGRTKEATPPPEDCKVDTQGINDEIVVAVIEQLEKTGNRPHLLKELAAILCHDIAIVQTSANQPAIISSRLATFMKRQWTALAPCPLGKDLVGTHPKRIYFYLTTRPRQAFPDPPERQSHAARIITPSLTSAENEDEDKSSRSRAAMSPSPEVDLSAPELVGYDSPASMADTFPHRHSLSHITSHECPRGSLNGQTSPPLEGDEREFTQTATSLQQRRKSESMDSKANENPACKAAVADVVMVDDSEESRALHNRSDAAALFGHAVSHLGVAKLPFLESSPMLRPQVDLDVLTIVGVKAEHNEVRLVDDLSNLLYETVEMDELDELFAKY